MRIIAFIEQPEVIGKILTRLGLFDGSGLPPAFTASHDRPGETRTRIHPKAGPHYFLSYVQ
jgi:hypothetical protein